MEGWRGGGVEGWREVDHRLPFPPASHPPSILLGGGVGWGWGGMGVGWLKREGAKGGGGGGEDEEDEVEKEREAREKEREASKRCENARRQDRQGGGGP